MKCSVEFQTLPFARRAGEDAAVVAKPIAWYIHQGQLKFSLGKSAIGYHYCPSSYSMLHELLLLLLQNAFMILAYLLYASLGSLFHMHLDFLICLLNSFFPVFAGL